MNKTMGLVAMSLCMMMLALFLFGYGRMVRRTLRALRTPPAPVEEASAAPVLAVNPPAEEVYVRDGVAMRRVIIGKIHKGSQIGVQLVSQNLACLIVDGTITKGCLRIEGGY